VDAACAPSCRSIGDRDPRFGGSAVLGGRPWRAARGAVTGSIRDQRSCFPPGRKDESEDQNFPFIRDQTPKFNCCSVRKPLQRRRGGRAGARNGTRQIHHPTASAVRVFDDGLGDGTVAFGGPRGVPLRAPWPTQRYPGTMAFLTFAVGKENQLEGRAGGGGLALDRMAGPLFEATGDPCSS